MAFCTNCGAKLEDGHRFCCNCGTMVADESPVASPVPEIPVSQQYPEAPAYNQQESLAYSDEPAAEPELPSQEIPQAEQNEVPVSQENSNFVYEPVPDAYPVQYADTYAQGSGVAQDPVTAEKKKAARPRRKFLPAFGSVLICIFLVVLMLPTFTLLTAQNLPKQDTLLTAMNRIDMDELPASILDENDRELKKLSLAEYICDTVNSDMENLNNEVISYRWNDLTPKTLKSFLEDTTFLSFFAEHIEGAFDAMLSGEESYEFSSKSIQNLMEENKEYIIEEMNVKVSDREYDRFVDYMVEDGLEIEDIELPEMDEGTLDLVNFLLSFWSIAALCLVLVLLIVLLFVTNGKDRLFAVHDTGVSLIVGSGLFLLVTLAARILTSILVDEDPLVYLGSVLVSSAAESILLIVGGVLAVGVILLLVNFFVRKHQSKRAAQAMG